VMVMYTTSFMAFQYDSLGARFLGSNIVDAAIAYDKNGNFVEDITYTLGASFATFEYTNTSARMIDNGSANVAVLIHPFRDFTGGIGLEVEYFDSVTTNQVIEYSATGVKLIATDAAVDKAFAIDNRQFVSDVSYISSNSGFEYSDKDTLFLGSNIPI